MRGLRRAAACPARAQLQRLPAGARTVLHGGASGSWYFHWFDDNYPGSVERHIGVEAFGPRPDDLPVNVEWLAPTFGDMGPVADGSVDMVVGGQVIEHLWPQDVAGLLLESRAARVRARRRDAGGAARGDAAVAGVRARARAGAGGPGRRSARP